MTREFYGPKADAELIINELFNLPASGKEQDWEIELADPERIDEMLDVLELNEMNFDCKSALCLLIVSSIEEANEAGMLNDLHVQRVSKIFSMNYDLREMMWFYWIHLGRARNINLIKNLFVFNDFD